MLDGGRGKTDMGQREARAIQTADRAAAGRRPGPQGPASFTRTQGRSPGPQGPASVTRTQGRSRAPAPALLMAAQSLDDDSPSAAPDPDGEGSLVFHLSQPNDKILPGHLFLLFEMRFFSHLPVTGRVLMELE